MVESSISSSYIPQMNSKMHLTGTTFLSTSRCQRYAYLLIALLAVLGAPHAYCQKAVPQLWNTPIHDEAKVLSEATIQRLENDLKKYEDSTTNQIALLIISSLDGESIEDYSLRVVEEWKLGVEGKDNGVLLLIAIDDHKMRIEVGYGLEGVLTDAICSRIIRNELAPSFRQNQYDEGVVTGINAIIAAIGGEYSSTDDPDMPELNFGERLLIGLFIFGVLGVFTFLGLIVPGCGGWFLYAFLIPFYAIFPMIVLGINPTIVVAATYIIGFPILKLLIGKTGWGKRMAAKMQSSRGGTGRGWSSSGWSSGSSWSGGGGSSGGFSGGGGSFGGGGSSGSW
jgi:uncharacterized protein